MAAFPIYTGLVEDEWLDRIERATEVTRKEMRLWSSAVASEEKQ